ncbi:MAG: hypothetical protein IT580_13855 [Verrucomicrobiales bacterium]|nr:hypothetical protein [Verrucomicrobiales bacterium]
MVAAESWTVLYAEWRRLTEAEAEAIEKDAWELLSVHQQAKSELRDAIVDAEEARGPCEGDEEVRRRQVIAELICLETRNHEAITRRRCAAQSQQADLERRRMDLRRIQRAHAHGTHRDPVWQQYS